jgi:1-aminocyclopropane-1-carboxylate deaminase/D-cysteine desulfhydrase-like pyridoxal-dependent ACC family enzyme
MLAAPEDYYRQQQQSLTAAFCAEHAAALGGGEGAATEAAAAAEAVQQGLAQRLRWVQRPAARKFGKVLPGEVAVCRAVAQRHGILLDPIWSLAAWEASCQLAEAAATAAPASTSSNEAGGSSGGDAASSAAAFAAAAEEGEQVAMLHTGGMLGLCGLAQRFPDQF